MCEQGNNMSDMKNNTVEDKSEKKKKSDLLYGVEDTPSVLSCFGLGLQHFLLVAESTISIPYVLTPFFCMDENDVYRGYITSTILFICGLATILQSSIGVRLPIMQGGSHGFLAPILAVLYLYPCPPQDEIAFMTDEERKELWQMRMREIQGCISIGAIFQILIGSTGALGMILVYITPLVIVPAITLIGLSVGHIALAKSSSNWSISLLTFALVTLFSQYLTRIEVPYPTISKKKVKIVKSPIFVKFPVLIAIILSWGTCLILTLSNVLPENDPARTDLRLDLVTNSSWLRVPYPFQWGIPTASVAGVLGILSAILSTTAESIGDYYACARIAGEQQPPTHAVNRGIFMEGIGTILSGLFGTGSATTSYSQNIAAISITRVGSRRVVQCAGLLMVICGLSGKIGSFFVTIPEPIIGGIFIMVFGMITSVGLSALHKVNLKSNRNLFVLGISLMCGANIPQFINKEENKNIINTSSKIFNESLTVLLSTSMLVGGVIAFILDNTVPGKQNYKTDEDLMDENQGETSTCYDLPYVMDSLYRWKWTTYIPISPTFRGWRKLHKRNSNESIISNNGHAPSVKTATSSDEENSSLDA